VIDAMPFLPLRIADQHSSVPVPTELNKPTPVTTTLRGTILPCSLRLLMAE
jgi:hypothetical protein